MYKFFQILCQKSLYSDDSFVGSIFVLKIISDQKMEGKIKFFF